MQAEIEVTQREDTVHICLVVGVFGFPAQRIDVPCKSEAKAKKLADTINRAIRTANK